jgi:hypothetical protein
MQQEVPSPMSYDQPYNDNSTAAPAQPVEVDWAALEYRPDESTTTTVDPRDELPDLGDEAVDLDDLDDYDLDRSDELASYLSEHDTLAHCPRCGALLEFDDRASGVLAVWCPTMHGKDAGHVGDLRTKWKRGLPTTSVPVVLKPTFVRDPAPLRLVRQALTALVEIDGPAPTIFDSVGELVEVKPDGKVVPLNSTQIQIRLGEAANWTDGSNLVDAPSQLASALFKLGDFMGIVPRLDRVVTAPVMQADGSLLVRPGYDRTSRTVLVPVIDPVASQPPEFVTHDDVAEAVRLITEELIGDFPFVHQSDRAHAVGMLLLPFLRGAIDGPTPLHWVTAPTAGTGKTKLVDTLLAAGCGRVPASPWPKDDNEQRKTVTSLLRGSPIAVKWDNVRGKVESQTLELALTENTIDSRLLGFSTQFSAEVRCVWTLTANNGQAGPDMVRRIVPIHLDAEVESPASRQGPSEGSKWRHDLPNWAHENRAELARAALVLCRNWVQAGSPSGYTGRRGSFEEWERVVGGVLAAAGISGFLDDLDEITVDNPERDLNREMFASWFERYGSEPKSSRELADDGWVATFTSKPSDATAGSIGHFLKARKDQRVGTLVLKLVKGSNGVPNRWQVTDEAQS